jgi:hypothetical protein
VADAAHGRASRVPYACGRTRSDVCTRAVLASAHAYMVWRRLRPWVHVPFARCSARAAGITPSSCSPRVVLT